MGSVALALYAERALASADDSITTGFEEDNSTAKYIGRFEYRDPAGGVVTSLRDWVGELRDNGTEHVRVVVTRDERYAIAGEGPLPSLWSPAWGLGDIGDPRGRVWAVTLVGDLLTEPLPPPQYTFDEAAAKLRGVLHRAVSFTDEQALDVWAEIFIEALRLLRSPAPEIPYHADLAPAGTALSIRRVLAAAVRADVTGRLGAWRELRFAADQVEDDFVELSDDLALAIRNVYVAATSVRKVESAFEDQIGEVLKQRIVLPRLWRGRGRKVDKPDELDDEQQTG